MDARCIVCDYFVPGKDLNDKLTACPNCGTSIPPLDPAKDIKININLDELKILTVWSDNHAENFLDDMAKEELAIILSRLKKQAQEQLPDKTISLTLKDEIEELKKEHPDLFVEFSGFSKKDMPS